MEPVDIGLVGAGAWGSRYAEKLRATVGARLAAVADRDLDRARSAAAASSAFIAADAAALAGRVQAAVVAVPARSHAAVARPLLEAGVHVLMEKPFAASLEEADDLVALAARTGALLQAAHLERFNPAVVAALGLVRCPRFLEANRLGPFPGRGTDVDVVLDLMVHDLDLVLEFVGEAAERISARGVAVLSEEVDIANARIEFQGGCVADITASRVSLKRERKIRVFQPDAYLSLDCAEQSLQVVRRAPPARPGDWPHVAAESVPIAARDALADQVAAFVAAVREGTPPAVGPEVGRRALEAALAVAEEIRRWR
jgi:predicted dehydrogenase